MPSSPLALSLIHLAGAPLAAPSANASTKPSPTTAAHVLHDLKGKIEIILDGGSCDVGVESTVVDGLCNPPVVLRPGGLSMDALRECPGWEGVVKGYKDASEIGSTGAAPRAPGMKYKHYSPNAKVILYEASASKVATKILLMTARMERERGLSREDMVRSGMWNTRLKVGIVCTKNWPPSLGPEEGNFRLVALEVKKLESSNSFDMEQCSIYNDFLSGYEHAADMTTISLGKDTKDIAHGLFSALRELDGRGVDVICVEGIEDEGDIAAAVMNRLRKAATIIKTE